MKWQTLFVIMILAAAVIAAACTDEEPAGPAGGGPGPFAPGQVLYDTGDVTGSGTLGGNLVSGTIDTVTVTVGLVPGQKAVDMEKISIVYADAIRTETLLPVQGFRGDPPDGSFGILEVRQEIGRINNRLEDKELFVIRINPKAPLVPRQLITISIRPPAGPPLTIRRVAPATIVKENNILLPV